MNDRKPHPTTPTKFSRYLAGELKKIFPENGPGFSKILSAVCKATDTYPKELNLFSKLHNHAINQGKLQDKECLINVTYGITSNSFKIRSFTYDGKNLELRETSEYMHSDSEALKKLGKSLRKFSLAMGLEVFWLKSDLLDDDEVTKFVEETVKKHPPYSCLTTFKISFSVEDEALIESLKRSHKNSALGVFIMTHSAPYLPMFLNYTVGFLDNMGIPLNLSSEEISLLDNNITSIGSKIELRQVNLLTHKWSDNHLLFDLIHLSLERWFKEIKASSLPSMIKESDQNKYLDQPVVALDLPTIFNPIKGELTARERQEHPQKFQPMSEETRFTDDYFEVISRLNNNRVKEVKSLSKATNIIERAVEFSSLLNP